MILRGRLIAAFLCFISGEKWIFSRSRLDNSGGWRDIVEMHDKLTGTSIDFQAKKDYNFTCL